jgi:hypothetical protein
MRCRSRNFILHHRINRAIASYKETQTPAKPPLNQESLNNHSLPKKVNQDCKKINTPLKS